MYGSFVIGQELVVCLGQSSTDVVFRMRWRWTMQVVIEMTRPRSTTPPTPAAIGRACVFREWSVLLAGSSKRCQYLSACKLCMFSPDIAWAVVMLSWSLIFILKMLVSLMSLRQWIGADLDILISPCRYYCPSWDVVRKTVIHIAKEQQFVKISLNSRCQIRGGTIGNPKRPSKHEQ
jgi:hypothetical protein